MEIAAWFSPEELHLIVPEGSGLFVRQHTEAGCLHVHIHGLREGEMDMNGRRILGSEVLL